MSLYVNLYWTLPLSVYEKDEDYDVAIEKIVSNPEKNNLWTISFITGSVELLRGDCKRLFSLLQTAERVDVSPSGADKLAVDIMYDLWG